MGDTGLWQRLTAAWKAFRQQKTPQLPRPHSRLDTLLDVVPAVIYARSCDQQSVLTYVSGNVHSLLGYRVEEILADSHFWVSHLHADDRERCLGTVRSLYDLGQVEMEYRLRAKDGSWRWLHDECRVIRNPDGSSREIVGSCLDVSSRHRSELALARSEEELRAAQTRLMDALESSDDGFSVFDSNDCLIAFNSRYLSIYPSIADIIHPGVRFEDLLRISAQREQYHGVTDENLETWLQARLERHRNPTGPFEQLLGDGRWLEIVEHLTAEGGRVAIRRDITHRKRIEAALLEELRFKQTLIDTLPFPVFYKNTELIYLGCNAAFAEALGQTAESIVGKTLTETYSPEKAAEFRQRDEELLAHGGIQNYETTFRWGDGSVRQIAIVKAAFNDQDGKVAGLIGTIIDLTPQKQAEQQLVQTAKLVTLGQIASEVAHEINQPLSILRMTAENSAERLQRGELSHDMLADKLTVMVEQAGRMGEMIAHLRSFAHVEAEERRDFAPVPAVQAAIGSLAPQFMIDDITLTTELAADCPPLTGQSGQLEQLVLALLRNASDAVKSKCPPGQRRISVRLESGPQGLILSVEDNGGGIGDDLWPRIFAPFFTTKIDGTGLGLPISANIAATMGGRINGRNTGEGTLFQVVWPNETAIAPQSQPSSADPSRPRILVVDDEPLAVECITDYLTARDYQIVSAISPLDALELARDTAFDLVLTDQRMPGMDGNVLIARLRDLQPGLPAIMMSGGTMPLPPSGGGPVARLNKPLILEELGNAVSAALSPAPHQEPPPEPPLPTVETSAPQTAPAQRLWMMGELTAHLAHDFGQPLNIIRLSAENALDNLADNRLSDDRLRRTLGATIEQCQRLQSLAQSLVAATRRPTSPQQRFSPLEPTRRALAAIQDRIRMQAITLSWHANAKLPSVTGYPDRLETALAQLLDNACEVLATEAMARHADTPPWQAHLRISCDLHPQGGISICIADNGPGLPSQVRHDLASGVGKGLGLPIALGIVAEMGGTLDFASPAIGTEIRIHLPLARRHLYVVGSDDTTALTAWGWDIATSPAEAEAALVRRDGDALSQTLGSLRQTRPDLPIVVAADLDEAQSRHAVAAGAMMVVAADTPQSDLAECLDECLAEACPT